MSLLRGDAPAGRDRGKACRKRILRPCQRYGPATQTNSVDVERKRRNRYLVILDRTVDSLDER